MNLILCYSVMIQVLFISHLGKSAPLNNDESELENRDQRPDCPFGASHHGLCRRDNGEALEKRDNAEDDFQDLNNDESELETRDQRPDCPFGASHHGLCRRENGEAVEKRVAKMIKRKYCHPAAANQGICRRFFGEDLEKRVAEMIKRKFCPPFAANQGVCPRIFGEALEKRVAKMKDAEMKDFLDLKDEPELVIKREGCPPQGTSTSCG